jgi:predicted cupin superfamily sugar epimerase
MKELAITQKIESIKNHLTLLPHPEGGFYKETYRSEGNTKKPFDGASERSYSTGIYFMLVSENFSAFHRIKQDEMWHFYDGNAINLHIITALGKYELIKIGRNFLQGEVPQYVVKAGDWFASEVSVSNGYSLAGCTVSPGFDFADFEMADRNELLKVYPRHEQVSFRLTRN